MPWFQFFFPFSFLFDKKQPFYYVEIGSTKKDENSSQQVQKSLYKVLTKGMDKCIIVQKANVSAHIIVPFFMAQKLVSLNLVLPFLVLEFGSG